MTITFICAGNTCRSPMAEALARHLFDQDASSAGIAAGQFVHPHAVKVMDEIGIDISALVPRRLTAKDLEGTGNVVVMSALVAWEIKRRYPDAATTLYWFGEEIPDPFGGALNDYRCVRDQLRDAIGRCVEAGWPRLSGQGLW